MNEKDVAFFSELLGLSAEDVESAANDGGLSERVQSLNLMTPDQVDQLKSNLTKEVQNSYHDTLVEQAKKGEVDGELYKVIKGASYEMLEKELSREHGIEDYDNVKDLVSKAVSKNKTATNDKQIQELSEKLKDLQAINENLVKEKDEAVKTARTEYEGKILSREKIDNLRKVPMDFSDVDENELEKVTQSRMQILGDVFDARFQLAFNDDKVIVKNKEGKAVSNPATLEPLPVSDVMRTLAAELGMKLKSPESGGQGGSSSGKKGTQPFKDEAEYRGYLQEHNIRPNSQEAIKLWAERRPKV